MGYDLARAVLVHWRHLPSNPYKVLNQMAHTALDTPNEKGQPANLYFGGWELLAVAMGRDLPAAADEAGQRRRKKIRDEVTRTVGVLVDAGAVTRLVEHPRTGQQQTYRLTLSPTVLRPHKSGGQETPQIVGPETPQIGGGLAPRIVGDRPHKSWGPRNQEDQQEEALQDSTTTTPLSPQGVARTRRCGKGMPIAADGSCGCADHWEAS